MKMILKAFFYCVVLFGGGCKKENGSSTSPPVNPPVNVLSEIDYWITRRDGSILLQKQSVALGFTSQLNNYPFIDIDSLQGFQTIDGFGFTLTGGSADVIMQLNPTARQNLLKELFTSTGINISYLRISIGASDLNAQVFSYDDMPAGQTDVNLQHFNLSKDTVNTIPLLQEINALNPSIRIMATPWSAPPWMKDNGSSIGGKLQLQYYHVYASYFVKYIRAMQQKGVTIDAITIQNEPMHGGNNPSMLMTENEQAVFIKDHLGPAFNANGLQTKIIIWDHNCDQPQYPLSILNDAQAKQYVDGTAFHLYAGDINTLSQIRNAHPDRNIYFTEQYTASNGSFGGDLAWHIKNVIIGSMRNWSRVALEWNLANNASFGPHTPGGCNVCKGGLTIDGQNITRNVGYYIIAHASKFISPGSTRIYSNSSSPLHTVAFSRPDGKKVLLVLNEANDVQLFNIRYRGKWATTGLEPGSVATYVF